MININCDTTHKYGPFKKNDKLFYRVCLRCNKKNYYPICEEIENEYDNQRITDYIIEITVKKDLNIINNNKYFFKLVACLLDNISYIYLQEANQRKLLISLNELNNYFNKKDNSTLKLIKEVENYLKKYFNIYNDEINNNYNDNKLNSLDDNYLIVTRKVNEKLELIISNEKNTLVTVDNIINEEDNIIKINYNEEEQE